MCNTTNYYSGNKDNKTEKKWKWVVQNRYIQCYSGLDLFLIVWSWHTGARHFLIERMSLSWYLENVTIC